jgi:hypothetical protein
MTGTRLFTVCFTIAAALVFGSGAAVNIMVDPYGFFGSPVYEGFNTRKPTALFHDRLLKASAARAGDLDCITAGSSRIGEGLPLDHPFFEDCTRPHDLSLAGATATDMANVVRVAMRHNKLKRVVLGLDVFMFNATRGEIRGSTAELYSDSLPDQLKVATSQLFSLSGVADSWTTVWSQDAPAFHQPDGTTDEDFLRVGEAQRDISSRFLRCSRGYIFHHLPPPNYVHTSRHGEVDTYATFRALLVDLHREGIEVVIFVPPAHAWNSELIHALGLWSDWENLKRFIFIANRDAATLTNNEPFAYWDFSGYGPATMEPLIGSVGPDEMRFHWDCSHFKTALGRLILDQWVSRTNMNLGVEIDSPAVLETQLAAMRAGRRDFERTRPMEAQLVERVVDCFAAPSLTARLGRQAPPESVCRDLRRVTR